MDEIRQFVLYDEYVRRYRMLMKNLLLINVLFYAKEGMMKTEILTDHPI